MFKSLFCNLHEVSTKYEKTNQFQRGLFLALNARSPLSSNKLTIAKEQVNLF